MNIQAEKLELLKMILEINDPEILDSIKGILQKSKTQNPDSLRSDQLDEILWEMDDIENDDIEDFDEFIKKYGR